MTHLKHTMRPVDVPNDAGSDRMESQPCVEANNGDSMRSHPARHDEPAQSMTSSALASKVGASVSPSALAVLRLKTSLVLVGA